MYIVNFNNNHGWRIYSSDKRTPAVIAYGEKGYFSINEGSPAFKIWISNMVQDITKIRNASDNELKFTNDEIISNKAFWSQDGSRYVNPPLDTLEFPPFIVGHWEESVTTSIVEYDRVDHMVAKWDQGAPYNEFSPYYNDSSGDRAYAGCVAIAGAQVLYYLHDKIGVPTTMCSSGYCIGDINNFNRAFTNQSSTIWSSMSMNYRYPGTTPSMLPEALLIGYVGSMVNMHYCDNITGRYSWALPRNLKDNLFDILGINCTYTDYNENVVKNSLLNQLPVIVSASNLIIPVDGNIHCFVIDGYRRTCIKYTHHHYFVLDQTPTGIYTLPEEYMTYTYSSPQLTEIKMNWGWWTQWKSTPVNDGWYSLTGSWYVENNGDYYDFNHNMKMIHGFSVR